MRTARRHFPATPKGKKKAAEFARQKKTEGYNTGALRMPIRGESNWIIFWSVGFLNGARAVRA
jgi:hypothetical protein